MSQTNFLIGRGELLTHDIKGPKRMPGKAEVYTLQQARERLTPSFQTQLRRWMPCRRKHVPVTLALRA